MEIKLENPSSRVNYLTYVRKCTEGQTIAYRPIASYLKEMLTGKQQDAVLQRTSVRPEPQPLNKKELSSVSQHWNKEIIYDMMAHFNI